MKDYGEDEDISNNNSREEVVVVDGVDDTQATKQSDHDKNIREARSLTENNSSVKSCDFTWMGPIKKTQSEVWKHWGFKKFSNKDVDRSVVFCKVCGHSVKYKGSSPNMKAHLLSRHPNMSSTTELTQPKASDYLEKGNLVRKQKYPKHHPINKQARNGLVKWICKRDRPFLMVEDKEFAEFCEVLNPSYELPCRETVKKDMEETYKVEKEKFMKKLERVPFLFGTNDGATAMNAESFVCNTVHYVDPDTWKLEHETLGCKVMKKNHTAKNYRDHIDITEDEFGIRGKVIGYTTDNENKMHKAFEDDQRNGCITRS